MFSVGDVFINTIPIRVTILSSECLVNKLSFEESPLTVSYDIGSGPITMDLPAVLESPNCGGIPASYTNVKIKSISSNRAKEDVLTTVSLDSEKAAITIDTQDYSFVGQDVTLIIQILSTNNEAF